MTTTPFLTLERVCWQLPDGRLLFSDLDETFDARPTGLVGRNGVGKSVLAQLLAGRLAPTRGRCLRSGPVAWLPQQIDVSPTASVADLAGLGDALAALHRIEQGSSDVADFEVLGERWQLREQLQTELERMQLCGVSADTPASRLSGGQRMRVALAGAFLSDADFLVLDEPSNHLDAQGRQLLREQLLRWPRGLLVVSHDRELLDTCVDHILHLDQGKLTIYRGGYSAFEKLRAEKQANLARQREKQDAERKHLQAFVDRFKAKATKARQAQSRVKRLEKMQEIAVIEDRDVQPFSFPAPERPLSPPMVVLEGASAGYGDRTILSRLNLTLSPDDRIALLGSNGNGKSTFCKLIGGRLEPKTGQMRRSSKLQSAYFAQHQLDELRMEDTPVGHIRELMPDQPEARVRARTAQIGFPAAKADTPVKNLSGGEKARLMLGIATFGGPHLMILDEPTNHLDIDSRTALVRAINDYPGAVILVSHDRFLIEACADQLWLVADGTVKSFDGDMEDYRSLVLGGAKAARREKSGKQEAPPSGGKAEDRKGNAQKRAAQGPLRQKLNLAEARIAKLTGLIEKVDEVLGNGAAFARDPEKALQLSRQRAELAEALGAAEEEWLSLSEELESA